MRAIFLLSSWAVLLLFSMITATLARADQISIEFEELDQYASKTSASAKILEKKLQLTLAERDENLKWSNPEVAYDREDVEQAEEFQITLGKQIEMPWVYFSRRGSWKSRVKAAELSRTDNIDRLLAELKSGYVRLKLLDEQQNHLDLLRDIITDASHAASKRQAEGHISGIDEHLIQMFLITMMTQYQSVIQEKRLAEIHWKVQMGIDPGTTLELPTEVDYQVVELPSMSELTGVIENRPGYLSQLAMQEWLKRRAKTERRQLFPSFNLYGGFKKVDSEFDGYVVGVALDLPLFNLNGASVRRFEIESDIAARETEIYRRELSGRIEALISSSEELRQTLSLVADHVDQDMKIAHAILLSYEEGWMSLGDFLNSIQIEVTGMQDYYDQLIDYYSNLFELEAITGSKLVSFVQ